MSEYSCMGCGKPDLAGIDLHVDHINPGHQGNGEYEWDNSFENLRILCSVCNGRKKDRQNFGLRRVEWKNPAWF
jgi:5-methylcytosine-specific restriction endonuclease McrA